MIILLIVIHVIACTGLIILVLIQRGRGSGLVESFQGVESMFGTKTSVFLTRSTTVLSIIFFVTCLSLAALSVKQSRSLLKGVKPQPAAETKPAETTAEQAAQAVQEATPAAEEKPAAEQKSANAPVSSDAAKPKTE